MNRELINKVFCAVCLGFFVLGLTYVGDATAEWMDDSLPARPAGYGRILFLILPFGHFMEAVPILAGVAYFLCIEKAQLSRLFVFWHGLMLVGGCFCHTGAWVIRWFGLTLNGGSDAHFGSWVGNLAVVSLLMRIIVREMRSRKKPPSAL